MNVEVQVIKNQFSLICSTFICTMKLTPFHAVSHVTSYTTYFSWLTSFHLMDKCIRQTNDRDATKRAAENEIQKYLQNSKHNG
jgi:hypothetical protein